MLKTLSYFLCVVLLAITSPVFAHAVVTDVSLKIAPLHVGKPSEVSLTFNAKVELSLSQFHLVKKGDVHEKLTARLGSKRGEVIIAMPALELGEHALKVRVFAVDGHLTDDIIRFFVVE